MHVSLVGINHQTASITIREKLAINADRLPDSLLLLLHHVPHGVIISTCNRIEVYAVDNHPTEQASINFLNATTGVSFADLLPHIYLHKNETAFEHLFCVASGLDSMIIGEFEVLKQVGQALETAEKAGMVNLPLRNLFRLAIQTGRRVREETGISRDALSVSSVAVGLATGIVGDLESCRILVIGAGEAGRLVAKAAQERGASQIVVYNRSREKASALAAALGTTRVASDNLTEELSACDIAISCTGAPHLVLRQHQVEQAMSTRPARPLVIVDIAVPRDVEPGVKLINNVFLDNIDDLTHISDSNRNRREHESQRAMAIVAVEVDRFSSWWRALEVRPVVSALMNRAEDIRCTQLQKTLKKLRGLSDEERDNLEAMTKSIVTKILQDPIRHLKSNIHSSDYVEIVSELFQLDKESRG